jgi:glycosyltransferase involved in cell wall biosynthesis
MHLAIVSPFPPAITGIGQYGYHVTRALAATGLFNQVTVLAGAHSHQKIDLGKVEIDYCWQPDQLKARQIILSTLRRIKPDLVWFNLGASVFGKSPLANLSGMLTPMLTMRMGYPTVVTLHELVSLADLKSLNAPGGIFAPLGAHLLTKIATQADIICLTLRHYADWLSARGVDCTYIPIGAYYEPELLNEQDSQELLFFTTLAPYKGLEILLESFESLRMEFPCLRLTIAGAEHTRFPGYARDLKSRFNGTHNIQWLGQVGEEHVVELFRNAQIVVLPYTAATGSSSVLYQAATWGRAVVASDLSENLELARENDLQIQFFKSGDQKSLREAIRTLLNSPILRDTQTKHNFNAIQSLRPGMSSAHYIEAFNRALGKHNRPQQIPIIQQELELP